MYNSSMEHQYNIVINKMLCTPTERVYKNMYSRNYSIGMTPHDAERLNQYFDQSGVKNNCKLNIISAANNIGQTVKLSATPNGRVDIPHGWNTQRLMFLLAVDEYVNDNCSKTHYIQGYTEYYDPSYTGVLDPNAIYYINSITTVVRTRNPITNLLTSRVFATYNVIPGVNGSVYERVNEPSELVRPTDVLTSMYAQKLYSDLGDANLSVSSHSVSGGANVSTRNNNDPLKYFTNTVNAVIVGKSTSVGYNTPEDVISTANSSVAETAMTDNGFIYALARVTGVFEPNQFTLDVLQSIDPGVANKITLVQGGQLFRDPTTYNTELDTEVTEDLLNYTVENDIAQTFVNSLTSAMSENLITVISGTVTNITGANVVAVSNLQSFLEGVDIRPYGNRMINHIEMVLMPILTVNNIRIVSIAFECDLLVDTTVSVSVDNMSPIVYRLPTFADSLYTPMLANQASKEDLLSGFETVVDTVMSMSEDNIVGEYNGY